MKNARRSGLVARICRAANWNASSQEIRRKPRFPRWRIIGYGRRPSSRRSWDDFDRNALTSSRRRVRREPIVFSGSRSRRTVQRWIPSIVKSRRPVVPRARPTLVIPSGPEDFAVVVGLREAESERDRAHAPDALPPPAGGHVPRKRRRLIFL